jgi:PPOX class probable FMN-dependent enzyme
MEPMTLVTTVEELRAIVGEPGERARTKVRPRLDPDDIAWLGAATIALVATSSADGRCDVSPKGDPAGSLVHVVDPGTIALAERPGNRRVDGYLNILENPHAGLIFIIPGRSDTLRVNGRARLVRDAPWFADLSVQGKRPVLALVVEIEEVFGHCARSLVRGRAWHPDAWDPFSVDDVSASARERRARGERTDLARTVTGLEEEQIASYGGGLY